MHSGFVHNKIHTIRVYFGVFCVEIDVCAVPAFTYIKLKLFFSHPSLNFRLVFTIFISNITPPKTFFFTIGGTMGCIESKCLGSVEDARKLYAENPELYPAYYHPDLYAVFQAWSFDGFKGWDRPLRENGVFLKDPDQGWIRNSPLRIELEDLLNGALKAMGGWPKDPSYCFCYRCPSCCDAYQYTTQIEAQMVEEFNKVCKKFNDAKLFDTGLQCRAIMQDLPSDEGLGGIRMLVLVEKKDDEKLRDVDPFKYFSSDRDVDGRANVEEGLKPDWSPPENWMTRLTPPYNETTNHVANPTSFS